MANEAARKYAQRQAIEQRRLEREQAQEDGDNLDAEREKELEERRKQQFEMMQA